MNNQNRNLLKASFVGSFAEAMLTPIYALFVQIDQHEKVIQYMKRNGCQ
jgi:hypothetical protein